MTALIGPTPRPQGVPLNIRLQLSLPRDARYVGTLREVAGRMLRDVQAPEQAVDDVQLALSEACNNVIRHAAGTSEYGVTLAIADQCCEIEVVDLGPGFTPPDLEELRAPLVSEEGRGLLLMHALVDRLEFVEHHDGTRLRLRKHWDGWPVPQDDPPVVVEDSTRRP